MTDALRILQVLAPGAVGGLERVVQLLVGGFHQRGRDVQVLAVLDRSGVGEEFLEPLERIGVSIHRLRIRPRNYAAELHGIRRVIRTLSPNVVHTHGSRVDVLDATMARLMGFPTITTVHGASRLGGRAAVYEWLHHQSYRRFEAVVAVSEPLRLELIRKLKVPPERVYLIPNAWPGDVEFLPRVVARQRLAITDDALPVLGWIGRLIPVKAADVFLFALSRMADVPWHAVIVGDGPERAALTELAASLGIAGRVHFAGTIVHAAQFNRAFDLYVLSSRSEGTPIALLEAMAAGVPVIATDVGGVQALLGDRAGVLVPPNDAGALAAAMRKALSDSERMAKCARSAEDRIRNEYAPDRFLDRYDEIYQLLGRGSPGTREPRSH